MPRGARIIAWGFRYRSHVFCRLTRHTASRPRDFGGTALLCWQMPQVEGLTVGWPRRHRSDTRSPTLRFDGPGSAVAPRRVVPVQQPSLGAQCGVSLPVIEHANHAALRPAGGVLDLQSSVECALIPRL